jgi:hypothetical protein
MKLDVGGQILTTEDTEDTEANVCCQKRSDPLCPP